MTFKPGESGNSKGRPKGLKDKRTFFRDMLEPNSKQLLEKAVSLALDGNEAMLKLLLERLLPARPKDNPIQIKLPNDDLSKQNECIITELNNGNISPSTALMLSKYVTEQIKIIEFCEVLTRLDTLEKTFQASPRGQL